METIWKLISRFGNWENILKFGKQNWEWEKIWKYGENLEKDLNTQDLSIDKP